MSATSPLQPIDPAALPDFEKEKEAPWIVRKLVGSMTGRVVMSSYETLRAAGTNVLCLSAWGDSSPLFLPCIRFRDLLIQSVMATTGGTAAIAAPAMAPVMDTVADSSTSIAVEISMKAGFDLGTQAADDFLIEGPIEEMTPLRSPRLSTTSVKTLLISLKYKHTITDAALGYFRSSLHEGDPAASMFSSVKDYLSIENGWWNPTLFASGRRPCIPRSIQADVVFCHGPFLSGDYRMAETLLSESASVVDLAPPALDTRDSDQTSQSKPWAARILKGKAPPPAVPAIPNSPPLRRLAILTVGISPYRSSIWTSSARPDESLINYHLLNGCPALILPAQDGCPLIAWDTLTLKSLYKKDINALDGVVGVLWEYVSMCVDWERAVAPEKDVQQALEMVVAGAMRSRESGEVNKVLDLNRAGIVMLRLP